MNIELLLTELEFKAIRSGGPGGQHANKTASRVEVSFNIPGSAALSENEKKILLNKPGLSVSAKGDLVLQCSDTRSQHQNKKIVIGRLLKLLEDNLKTRKKRRKTKIPKAAVEKRLKEKRKQALKKKFRKPPAIE